MRLLEKWSSILFMPVKDNNYHASVWLTLLARTFSRYFFASYYRAKDEYSKKAPNPYNGVFIFNVCCLIQENQMYFKSIFVIKLQLLLCFYLSMCYKPCAFIWACYSD